MRCIRDKHISGRTTLTFGRGAGEARGALRVNIAHLLPDLLENLCCGLAQTTNNAKVEENRDGGREGGRVGGKKGGREGDNLKRG